MFAIHINSYKRDMVSTKNNLFVEKEQRTKCRKSCSQQKIFLSGYLHLGTAAMHTELLIRHFLTDSLNSLMSQEGISKAAILQLVSALPFLMGRTFSLVSFLCPSISQIDGMLPNVSFHIVAP